MTLEKITWVLIRIAGVFFFYQLLMTLIGFVGAMSLSAMGIGKNALITLLLSSLGYIVAYFILGYYCLTDGRLIHSLINQFPEE